MDSPSESEREDLGDMTVRLPMAARRELAMQLLWSLPRDEVIALNKQLSTMLQKDIIGALPAELALLVLSHLDLYDLLKCALVSHKWAALCNNQALWAHLCATTDPPIHPSSPTWSDLNLHSQLMHLPPTLSSGDDDSASDPEDIIALQGGLGGGGGRQERARMPHRGLKGRGAVWERPTASTGSALPLWIAGRGLRISTPALSDAPDLPTERTLLESHLTLPTSLPSVNYKHLYIVNRLIARRMRNEPPSVIFDSSPMPHKAPSPSIVKPKVLDAISSIESGGLPGHSEAIYSLELFRQRMTVRIPVQGHIAERRDGEPLMSFMGPGMLPPGAKAEQNFSGRDWLLSGSRDRTLRLWQLSATAPRVVKVFHSGHEGSVLSHFVARAPRLPDDDTDGITSRSSRTGSGRNDKAVAISGGSDGRICLWDIEEGPGTPMKVSEVHTDSVLCVKGDNKRVVSCSKDRTIRVLDTQTFEQLLEIGRDAQHDGVVNAVNLSQDYIISAYGDRTIRIWSIHDGSLLASLEAASRGLASIAVAPTPPLSRNSGSDEAIIRATIVTGSKDASIRQFQLVEVPTDHDPEMSGTGAGPGPVTFREMLDHDIPLSLPFTPGVGVNRESPPDPLILSATQQDDALAGRSSRKLVIEPVGRCLAPCSCPAGLSKPSSHFCQRCYNFGHTDLVRSVAIRHGLILSGSYDSTVKIWDAESGRLLRDLSSEHSSRVFCVVSDRTRVISSGLDSKIHIWDFAEGLDTSFVEP